MDRHIVAWSVRENDMEYLRQAVMLLYATGTRETVPGTEITHIADFLDTVCKKLMTQPLYARTTP